MYEEFYELHVILEYILYKRAQRCPYRVKMNEGNIQDDMILNMLCLIQFLYQFMNFNICDKFFEHCCFKFTSFLKIKIFG